MFQRILLCVDGSERSLEATKTAVELAQIHHATLTLLHVCQPPDLKAPFPGALALAQPLLQQYVKDMHCAVKQRVQPLIQKLGDACEIIDETGDPAEVIARVADTREYDLVVMGSRNLDKEKANQLGSVSHNVLCRVHCPILMVR